MRIVDAGVQRHDRHRPYPIGPFLERRPEECPRDSSDQNGPGMGQQPRRPQRTNRQIPGYAEEDRVIEHVEDAVLRDGDPVQHDNTGAGDPGRAPGQGRRAQGQLKPRDGGVRRGQLGRQQDPRLQPQATKKTPSPMRK